MFNKENIIWLYFIGIIVLMIVVGYAGKEYFIPVILGERDTDIETGFVYENPPSMTINKDRDYRARINTNKGTLTIDLFENNAPTNVNNFVFLANQNYYSGTYFHRLVPGLFIQGGDRNTLNSDPSDDGFGGPGYIIKNEINWDSLKFDDNKKRSLEAAGYKPDGDVFSRPLRKYALAMASSGPDTNGSQFFIVVAEDDDPRIKEMEGKFTVIGEVIFGKEVLLSLASTEVDASNQLVPRPIQKLKVESIEAFIAN